MVALVARLIALALFLGWSASLFVQQHHAHSVFQISNPALWGFIVFSLVTCLTFFVWLILTVYEMGLYVHARRRSGFYVPLLARLQALPGTTHTLHLVGSTLEKPPSLRDIDPTRWLTPEERSALQAPLVETPEAAREALEQAERGEVTWVRMRALCGQQALTSFLRVLAHTQMPQAEQRTRRVLGAQYTLSMREVA